MLCRGSWSEEPPLEIIDLNLTALRERIKKGEISSCEATKAVLDRIEKHSEINAYITVCAEKALEQARKIDERRRHGDVEGTLFGVPIAVKDNISMQGVRTTCGSAFLKNYYPVYDATVVDKLKSAGAVILGKTNMDEFAMGSENKSSAYGRVLNPLDHSRVPGGSSGGSAAAVADKQCFGALGTDTGGSIRQPASYCGVVGIKPTYSSVSRYGLIAFASSLDQIGTLTRSVEDGAALLGAISGIDDKDGTTCDVPVDYENFVPGLKGRTIGVIKQWMDNDILAPDVRRAVENAVHVCQSAGSVVREFDIDCFYSAIPAYYAICCSEAASNLARFDGIRFGERASGKDFDEICTNSRTRGFGDEVKRRIMVGNYVLSAENKQKYFDRALRTVASVKAQFSEILTHCDAIIGPTAPSTAVKAVSSQDDKTKIYYSDQFAVFASLCGIPAISVPCGSGEDGMPAGLQIVGRAYDEKTVLSVAKAFLSEVN